MDFSEIFWLFLSPVEILLQLLSEKVNLSKMPTGERLGVRILIEKKKKKK